MTPRTSAQPIKHNTPHPNAPARPAAVDGLIEGYASLFGVIDGAGDMVIEGAFSRSLRRRGPREVKMLWQHKPAEPIGRWISLIENSRGLKVTGRLDLTIQRAREALNLIRYGAVDGLSIGFRAITSEITDRGRIRHLHEIDLWEISLVTFPMLTQARITTLKRD